MSARRRFRRLADAPAPRNADATPAPSGSAAVGHDHDSAWERAADGDKARARERLAAVRHAEKLIAIGIPRAAADATAAAQAGATARAVGDWRRKVNGLPQGTRVHALLDRKPTGRPPKIAGEVREILEALDNHNPAHLTARHCHRTLMARLGHAPAMSTIGHWLAARRRECAYERSAVADPDRHRSHRKPAGGDAAAHIDRLNQEWELDSTPADVICDDGLRYAVVVAIDIWSRSTCALVAPTSRAAAIAALFRRCLLDWGVPELVRTDEGADYTSRHVVGVIADLELGHDICPPFAPDAKPFVERVIKTIAHDLFANLPGFTGHNVADAQALRARKSFAARQGEDKCETFRVALSAEELQAYLDRWCDDLYGREPHDGLGGLSPFERVRSWTGPSSASATSAPSTPCSLRLPAAARARSARAASASTTSITSQVRSAGSSASASSCAATRPIWTASSSTCRCRTTPSGRASSSAWPKTRRAPAPTASPPPPR